MKYVAALILILLYISFLFCHTELQVQEVSRFAYATHDMADTRKPVVVYPYVYIPNSYGFQVCLWDSTANTFTEIANYGVGGMVKELVFCHNYLFISVWYNVFTDVQPDFGKLYRVDVTNPYQPVAAGSFTNGINDTGFGNLHVVNNVLLAYKEYNGYLQELVAFNTLSFEIIQSYPSYYRFDVIGDNYIISRLINTANFEIFSVNESGLTNVGMLDLPFPVNTFPGFITIGSNVMGTQFEDGITLWDTNTLTNWQQLSFINQTFSSTGVISRGRLIFANFENNVTRFYVYNVANPEQPTLLNNDNYPPGLNYNPGVYRLVSYGSFLLHSCAVNGGICLKLLDTGATIFIAQCCEFNYYSGNGRKYNNYILQPISYQGLACFDVSDPYIPDYEFTLFSGNSLHININGIYLWATLFPNNSNNTVECIYNISDLQNPVLVYTIPYSMQYSLYFNYNEPNSFYRLDNNTLQIQKFDILNNQVQQIFSYPIVTQMQSPAFVNNILYMSNLNTVSGYHLYAYTGFNTNNPQSPTIVINNLPGTGWVYNAGTYLFITNINPTASSCTFYNQESSFEVNNDLNGFNFKNYVCIGRETGVSFYDTSHPLSGFINEDFFLPQFSYSSHIDWDENYLYLFSNDNIAIYSYTLTPNDDNVSPTLSVSLNCYPNPWKFTTTISYSITKDMQVNLDIYNLKGQIVKTLYSGKQKAGEHSVVWDGTDEDKNIVSSGIYFYQLMTPNGTLTSKLVRLK